MKLTNEQIAIIDETLVLNGIIYDDLKLELIDHIATDIENQLENQERNFEVALKIAFENWSEQLRLSNSFWLNSQEAAPRIVIDKLSTLYKNLFKFSLIAVVIFSILMTTITRLKPEEYVYNNLKLAFSSVFFLFCLAAIISMFFIWKIKSKTISGKFFQKNCGFLAFHFYMIYTHLNGHSHLYRYYNGRSIFNNFTEWFLYSFFFFMTVYLVMIAVQHFRTVKKYKLV